MIQILLTLEIMTKGTKRSVSNKKLGIQGIN